MLSIRYLWLAAALLLFAACVAVTAGGQPAAVDTQPVAAAATAPDALLPPSDPPFSTLNWDTDFSRRTVPWDEILSGGPPKDGIPAIDEPAFESIDAAREWLSDRDPVILFQLDGDVRAYPLSILIFHEIVNDKVGGKPVAVTFCPLCNASIVFDSTLDGQVLDFGTTGNLRNSDLIMYDRQTETWWQQFTGRGIVGEHAGRQLAFLPSQVISLADFAAEFPDGVVLERPSFASRPYGYNPYTGYDSSTGRPSRLFTGELDERLPSTERVAGVALEGSVKAYPFSIAAASGAINDEMAGIPIVVFHKAGTASALDGQQISTSRDVGSVAVFDRRLDDQTLTFVASGAGTFRDEETDSTWNILGEAIDGPLAGTQLQQILAFDHFWFAWAAFHPNTEVYAES
ncbi:MAG: DUF3179 domain-containing protein [Caldilineaceae bacterium]|nr:DUF3179 domain-containing protein [Caldilineaceae bacterium]